MKSALYLVSTPIGNYDDITLRAIKVLSEVDVLVCEEYKEARRLLSHLKIQNQNLLSLNEHNENEKAAEILGLIKQGKSAALFSDCGTPVFSDPGLRLSKLCIDNKIEVIPVPGVSSLLTALTGAGINIDNFYYAGWISPKTEIRFKELNKLKQKHELLVFMETPYRLKKIISDIRKTFGNSVYSVLAYELTTENEKFYRGTISDIENIVLEKNLKGEFVLLIDNRK